MPVSAPRMRGRARFVADDRKVNHMLSLLPSDLHHHILQLKGALTRSRNVPVMGNPVLLEYDLE